MSSPVAPASNELGIDWLRQLYPNAVTWLTNQEIVSLTAQTPAYTDLRFAFGYATLGASIEAQILLESARGALEHEDQAHRILLAGYEYRIQQALLGKPHTGPLPGELLARMEQTERLLLFVIDRMRKQSIILEPDQRINPYRTWGRINETQQTLDALQDLLDREQFKGKVRLLLAQKVPSSQSYQHRLLVLHTALKRAPFAGEDFTCELLEHACSLTHLQPPLQHQDRFLWWHFIMDVLSATVHFRLAGPFLKWVDWVSPQIEQVLQNFRSFPLAELLRICVEGFFSLNLCEQADPFLNRITQFLTSGEDLSVWLQTQTTIRRDRLPALLQLAAGWYALGWDSLANPVLERARQELFSSGWEGREKEALACASIQAVRFATPPVADHHFRLLLEQLTGIRDTYIASSHYSVAQLEVIESLVLTAVEVSRRTW